jgi:hypothetical protein
VIASIALQLRSQQEAGRLALLVLKLSLTVPTPRLEHLEGSALAFARQSEITVQLTKTCVLFFFLPIVNGYFAVQMYRRTVII